MAVIKARVVDTTHLELMNPIDLPAGAHVVVSLETENQDERSQWVTASLQSLERAYGDDEPEYLLDALKTVNPDFNA